MSKLIYFIDDDLDILDFYKDVMSLDPYGLFCPCYFQSHEQAIKFIMEKGEADLCFWDIHTNGKSVFESFDRNLFRYHSEVNLITGMHSSQDLIKYFLKKPALFTKPILDMECMTVIMLKLYPEMVWYFRQGLVFVDDLEIASETNVALLRRKKY